MRKIIAILLILVMSMSALAFAGNVERNITTASITTDIRASGMPLQDLLDLIRQYSGITLAAVPEVADMKIDLAVRAGQTVGEVLNGLQERYGLTGKVNEAKTAVIVLQEYHTADRMMSGKALPMAVMNEASRMAAASPSLSLIRPIQWNTEEYKSLRDNSFQDVRSSPLSSFSIDVDTASFSNMRRFINSGNLPPPDAIRTEEFLNYFTYDYPQPVDDHPFSVTTEVGVCPWNSGHSLIMLGFQGKNVKTENLPPSNLVFLIDVSGSMASPNKLPLLKTAFKMLVQQLRVQDRVAIVVYAGAAGVVLDSTPGNEKDAIIAKIDGLQAGGSTAGSEGLKLAYEIANKTFAEGGNNRVILATDGDFNVGPSSEGELIRLIKERRDDGIFLSVLGFGMGNIKDNKMEALADHGNGNYAYIDNASEAKKVMVSQMAGTIFTIAKDVKIQIEFNPSTVKSYRLLGYENRVMENRDFNDDRKDAGDMGAGQSVTAIYEIIPAGSPEMLPSVDPLLYQQVQTIPNEDLMMIKTRYKKPSEENSSLMTIHIGGNTALGPVLSENFRFAAAVAEYGMLLRNSEYKGQSTYSHALSLARGARGTDANGYRAELIKLMEIAQLLDPRE